MSVGVLEMAFLQPFSVSLLFTDLRRVPGCATCSPSSYVNIPPVVSKVPPVITGYNRPNGGGSADVAYVIVRWGFSLMLILVFFM